MNVLTVGLSPDPAVMIEIGSIACGLGVGLMSIIATGGAVVRVRATGACIEADGLGGGGTTVTAAGATGKGVGSGVDATVGGTGGPTPYSE